MRNPTIKTWILCITTIFFNQQALSQLPGIEGFTKNMEPNTGFFTLYTDKTTADIYLEITEFNKEFIYQTSLPHGVGSNFIGLDRGQLSETRIVYFQRSGNKVLLIQSNTDYRYNSENALEKKAVKEAFAISVLHSFNIVAKNEDKVLIKLNNLIVSDAHGVGQQLKERKQGSYLLDTDRSIIDLSLAKSFPENCELEALVSFSGKAEHDEIRSVTPNPEIVSVRIRHSFIKLPKDDYSPRKFLPRSGYFSISYTDFSNAINESLEERLIPRHKITTNKDGKVNPIVYYVDGGAPEPIRSALIDGVKWWTEAFEAAGHKDAFVVKTLPDSIDPLDVRYNLVQWAPRSTRGWSYGDAIINPITGEILKGHVTLGALRVRQDYLLAKAMLPASVSEEDRIQFALARIRQLAAHEVGHTLGLSHNFAASTNNRASVMDYPHPYFELDDEGKISYSNAYDTGIGEWDKEIISYGYKNWGADEDLKLKEFTEASNIFYLSDQDSRNPGSSHTASHLWDNGEKAEDELKRVLEIRQVAIQNFSSKNVLQGEPLSMLDNVFVPLYLSHRYQLEAAVKIIGGLDYSYSNDAVKYIEPERQKQALEIILESVSDKNLIIPNHILDSIPPMPMGYHRTRENFHSRTFSTLDPLFAAEQTAYFTFDLLLNPLRLNRMIELSMRDKNQPDPIYLMNEVLKHTFAKDYIKTTNFEYQRSINYAWLKCLLEKFNNPEMSHQAKALINQHIYRIKNTLNKKLTMKGNEAYQAHYEYCLLEINKFREDPTLFKKEDIEILPPGSPIGMGCSHSKH